MVDQIHAWLSRTNFTGYEQLAIGLFGMFLGGIILRSWQTLVGFGRHGQAQMRFQDEARSSYLRDGPPVAGIVYIGHILGTMVLYASFFSLFINRVVRWSGVDYTAGIIAGLLFFGVMWEFGRLTKLYTEFMYNPAMRIARAKTNEREQTEPASTSPEIETAGVGVGPSGGSGSEAPPCRSEGPGTVGP